MKSSYSNPTGNCVDVRGVPNGPDGPMVIQVRDTKNPGLAPMCFTEHEWEAFIAGVKAGEFNLSRMRNNTMVLVG